MASATSAIATRSRPVSTTPRTRTRRRVPRVRRSWSTAPSRMGTARRPALTKKNGRGDVTDNGDGTWSWSLSPADDGNGSVQVQADDGSHSATDSFAWSAFNVAPTADISNDGPIDEGGSATVSLANAFDPSSEDTTAGFHYAFSCTDDPLPTAYADAGTDDSIVCPFADDGS